VPKNISDCDNTLNPERCKSIEEQLESGVVNIAPPGSGLSHTKVAGPAIAFKAAPNEKVLKNAGSFIVFGTDRPDSVASGYGAQGAQNANSIDLVVGRMASANEGKGPAPGSMVDNSFGADAARIYISQLADLDKNFGIEGAPLPTPRSGIAIKADGVRIIGREGIKIVTGRAKGFEGFGNKGETNSLGGELEASPPIELIAGNFVGDKKVPGGQFLPSEKISVLQPVNLGKNTRDAIQELSDIVGEIWSALFNFALAQSGVNTAVGVNPIMPWIPAAVAVATPIHLSYVINSLYHTRVNKTMWELNYLSPMGSKYICSRNVKTT